MLYDMHQTMEHDKQKIIVLANNVEKAERNSIQILGIFSAVIMFSASSVQIFSMTGITIDYAIKFMLAFGYCLVLFISLIWLISRDDHSRISLRYRVFFVVLLTATLMSLIYISNGDNNHKSNTENESILPKIRKDTINKIFQSPRPRLKHSPMT
jgi:glucan phosphoethanolaminetransferase (alkaline phosphatase superfamily)